MAHLRDEGLSQFVPEALAWNKESFRHELTLGADRLGRPIDFYFTARSAGGLERAYPLPGPDLPLRIPRRPKLFINEVLSRPSRGARIQEFVELYNASDGPISVDGMFLTDNRKNTTRFRISRPEPIAPMGFLVIHTDGRGEGLHASFRLGNAGEYLGLFHRAEEGNLLIDQVAFPAVPVDRSYGREQDGTRNFKLWRDPTPGARNIPKIPQELLKKQGEPEGPAAPPPLEPGPEPGPEARNPPPEEDPEEGDEDGSPGEE